MFASCKVSQLYFGLLTRKASDDIRTIQIRCKIREIYTQHIVYIGVLKLAVRIAFYGYQQHVDLVVIHKCILMWWSIYILLNLTHMHAYTEMIG